MKGLSLKSGGELAYVRWVEDEEAGTAAYVACDVTGSAAGYLMEPVCFEGDIQVRDLFSLLDCNPALVDVFSRAHAAEYLQESKKGDARAYTGEYDPNGIEYLELFYDWKKDPVTGELSGVHKLWVTGIGYELRDDIVEDGYLRYAAGSRIGWAIKFSPVGHLLNYPLRFNPQVDVVDNDDVTRTIETVRVPPPTLGQVIHAVMWELSWGGNPQETEVFVETLHTAFDEANLSEPRRAQDLIDLLAKPDEK
ncbi:hypothetical protein [Caballeronia glebae]|uniref:hypothetical protein n=1 Tax=Caballeronia glebae TaxID=1777143 RepID=UPI0038BA032A